MRPIFVFPLLAVVVGVPPVRGQDSNQPSKTAADSAAVELVEVLRGAVTAGEPTFAFELVGREETVREFEWGLDSSDTVDFRLQLDRKNESLRWAMTEKKETIATSGGSKESPGQLGLVGVSIEGGVLTRFSGSSSRPVRVKFDSFDEALSAGYLPSPQFFGVVPYQLLGESLEKELARIESVVMKPNTTIRVGSLRDGVRYVARNEESEKRFVVYTWEFGLPEYLPQSLTIDRSITGKANRIRSQRTFWEKSPEGHQRLFRIAKENRIRKVTPEGPKFGNKSVDVELVWLPLKEKNKMSFLSLDDVQKSLDIGKALAKHRSPSAAD